MAKTGRPLKEKTVLSHNVKVRLDDETHDRLLIYCGKNHEKAAVIREALKAFLDTALGGQGRVKKAGRKPQIISDTEKTEYRRNGSEYFRKHLERAWNFQK